ncbi:DNA-processing protein DprA [Candidatus Saccharibacteria bacterium]|nr:DNA-processing protein DprA [Candidatus Saccharibacteria bacterium]
MKINQIRPQDNEYLQILNRLALKPERLYYYGEWPKERSLSVAIVGARRCTAYGREVAYNLAKALGERGVLVVSGLAYGVDSIAARGALDGGGQTIAILGTEIERIYPQAHVKLAGEIVEKGGVVASEYKLGDKLDRKLSFLARNRIISGLADVVVVVEAAEKSGSLNTASHAIEQGKELYAVPGDINRVMSQGCNRLIFKGANPLLSVEEFLMQILPKKRRTKKERAQQISLFADTEEERKVLEKIAEGVIDGEEIMEELDMPVQIYNQAITMLEVKGAIYSLGMNRWSLT